MEPVEFNTTVFLSPDAVVPMKPKQSRVPVLSVAIVYVAMRLRNAEVRRRMLLNDTDGMNDKTATILAHEHAMSVSTVRKIGNGTSRGALLVDWPDFDAGIYENALVKLHHMKTATRFGTSPNATIAEQKVLMAEILSALFNV